MERKFYLMNIGGLSVKDPTDSSTVGKTSTYAPAYTHIFRHQKIHSEGFGGGGSEIETWNIVNQMLTMGKDNYRAFQ